MIGEMIGETTGEMSLSGKMIVTATTTKRDRLAEEIDVEIAETDVTIAVTAVILRVIEMIAAVMGAAVDAVTRRVDIAKGACRPLKIEDAVVAVAGDETEIIPPATAGETAVGPVKDMIREDDTEMIPHERHDSGNVKSFFKKATWWSSRGRAKARRAVTAGNQLRLTTLRRASMGKSPIRSGSPSMRSLWTL